MPRRPTVHDSPLKKFVCSQCNRRFRSKSGRTRHINAKHNYGLQMNLGSPQSAEADNFSDISSCLGSLNSDTFDFGSENNFNFGNNDIYNSGNLNDLDDSDIYNTPRSPSQDTASTSSTEYHPYLNGKLINIRPPLDMPDKFIGQPCDEDGDPLDPFSPPIIETRDPTDWTPFRNRVEFETAEFLYKRCQMSGANIDILMELWAAYSAVRDPEDISESSSNLSPFSEHRDLYRTIDSIPIGGVPWQSITLSFDGPIPDTENPPSWMNAGHTIWFRDPVLLFKNMLANPDFNDSFDYAPYRQYDEHDRRCYKNFMSGDWAWKQAVSVVRSCFTL
jgi:hypothetical protein